VQKAAGFIDFQGRNPVQPDRPSAPRPASPPPSATGTHGLARILSRLGLVSRKEAAWWIAQGRVTVDGAVARDPERRTDPRRERIAVDGTPVRAARKLYYVMNKPVGVLTSAHDPAGRKTVYDILREAIRTPGRAPGVGGAAPATAATPLPVPATGPDRATGDVPWLLHVGRLDAMTLGLLVFTNDTAFASLLLDERAGIPKTYEAKVRGRMEEEAVGRLRGGVRLDDGVTTRPAECRVLKSNEGTTWLEITLREGRYRQVRRMCQAVGHEVVKLRRVRIGPIELGDLPAGAVRPLTRREVEAIRSLAPAAPGSRPPGSATRRPAPGRHGNIRPPRRPGSDTAHP
jgi:23S rRNA pseudouridine2605 synthase